MDRYLLFFILIFYASSGYAESIAIFTYQVQGAKPWDPDSVKTGLTGSEEAVVYVSKELANEGAQVVVFGCPPLDSPYTSPEANPRFVPLNFQEEVPFDIAISWRMPHMADALKKRARRVFLWPHDTPPAFPITHAMVEGFDGVLWISHWQREQWMKANPLFAKFKPIFGNGICPEQFAPVKERSNPHACIYGSNYARGLGFLLDIWPAVKQQFPQATLDIYYGWQHWGLLRPEQEIQMRRQIATLAALGVREHGLVGHSELTAAYENASLWTYPCLLPEVFCITALRAQMAGAIPVIIENYALSETVPHGFKCHRKEDYFSTLVKALTQAEKISLDERKKMGDFIREEFTWKLLAQKWRAFFDKEKEMSTNSTSNCDPDSKG